MACVRRRLSNLYMSLVNIPTVSETAASVEHTLDHEQVNLLSLLAKVFEGLWQTRIVIDFSKRGA